MREAIHRPRHTAPTRPIRRVRERVPYVEESLTDFAVRRYSSTVTTYTTRRREP